MKGLAAGFVHCSKLCHNSIDRASAACFHIYEYPVTHRLLSSGKTRLVRGTYQNEPMCLSGLESAGNPIRPKLVP
jgi:hypothetical protein